MKRAKPPIQGAVLDPRRGGQAFSLVRHAPSPSLAPFVRHYWFVRWDLRGRPPYRQGTVPLPAVNAVLEPTVDGVYGVQTRRFDRELSGQGAAFGILFRPAGFHAFFGRPLHQLVDSALPFEDAFGRSAASLHGTLFRPPCATADEERAFEQEGTSSPEPWLEPQPADDVAIEALEAYLLAAHPVKTAEATAVDELVELIESDPSMKRAEDLARHTGVSLRTLQRRLRDYVGIGPKPIIVRFRILEAAARLVSGEKISGAALAAEVGYADQAHFVRDFSAIFGTTPARYAENQRSQPR